MAVPKRVREEVCEGHAPNLKVSHLVSSWRVLDVDRRRQAVVFSSCNVWGLRKKLLVKMQFDIIFKSLLGEPRSFDCFFSMDGRIFKLSTYLSSSCQGVPKVYFKNIEFVNSVDIIWRKISTCFLLKSVVLKTLLVRLNKTRSEALMIVCKFIRPIGF